MKHYDHFYRDLEIFVHLFIYLFFHLKGTLYPPIQLNHSHFIPTPPITKIWFNYIKNDLEIFKMMILYSSEQKSIQLCQCIFLHELVQRMHIDKVNWITAHNYGKPKYHSFTPSLSWKGNFGASTLSHKMCPRKQTTDPNLLILVSFFSEDSVFIGPPCIVTSTSDINIE